MSAATTTLSEPYWAMAHERGTLYHLLTHYVSTGSGNPTKVAACGARIRDNVLVWNWDILPYEEYRCTRCPQTAANPSWAHHESVNAEL